LPKEKPNTPKERTVRKICPFENTRGQILFHELQTGKRGNSEIRHGIRKYENLGGERPSSEPMGIRRHKEASTLGDEQRRKSPGGRAKENPEVRAQNHEETEDQAAAQGPKDMSFTGRSWKKDRKGEPGHFPSGRKNPNKRVLRTPAQPSV